VLARRGRLRSVCRCGLPAVARRGTRWIGNSWRRSTSDGRRHRTAARASMVDGDARADDRGRSVVQGQHPRPPTKRVSSVCSLGLVRIWCRSRRRRPRAGLDADG
jgi:hypothetical protein